MPCSFGNGWFAVTLNINFYILYNYTCPLLPCKFQFHSRRIQPKHQKMPRRFFLLGQPINCLGLGRLRLSTIIFNILSTSGDSKAVRRLSFQRSVQFENRIISFVRKNTFAWGLCRSLEPFSVGRALDYRGTGLTVRYPLWTARKRLDLDSWQMTT